MDSVVDDGDERISSVKAAEPTSPPRSSALPEVERGEPRVESGKHSSVKTALEYAGLVIAPTTFLTALAFYFGWALTSARSLYFGIDASTLDFSTRDYVLRSTDALFVPLSLVVIGGLVAVGFHTLISAWMASGAGRRLLRSFAAIGVVAGLTIFVIGVVTLLGFPFPSHYLVRPMTPGVGAILLAYMLWLTGRLAQPMWEPRVSVSRPASMTVVALVLSLAMLSAFWTISSYAKIEGESRAARLAATLGSRPRVIVLSKERLFIRGPGTYEARLSGGGFRFRYSGLRLLVRSNGKYFLLPNGWSVSRGAAIVLSESETLRFAFRPGD